MHHNINYCIFVSKDDDEEARTIKVLQAEKARAASAFERKCNSDKSTKRTEKKQNKEKKKKKRKERNFQKVPRKVSL